MHEIGVQQQMRPHQQQQFMPPSGQYQGNPGVSMMAQVQHNGNQFNSPPQHWMQQQIPHSAQPPSQRNPT